MYTVNPDIAPNLPILLYVLQVDQKVEQDIRW